MQQQPTTKLFLGNLSSNVTREILYEIGIQAGPVTSCVIPLEADKRPKSFGFIDYESLECAKYAMALFSQGLTLYGREVRVAYSPRGNTE